VQLYKDCITVAIQAGNWKLIKCMWLGAYHEGDTPNFNCIFEMAEFGNIKTFILGLYGVLNWDKRHLVEFTFEQLLLNKNQHHEVLQLITRITENSKLSLCLKTPPQCTSLDDKQYLSWRIYKGEFVKNLMKEYEMLDEFTATYRWAPPEEDV
jgi:hypothetical protein